MLKPGRQDVMLYIEADVPAGKPGESASYSGTPARTWVLVYPASQNQ